MQEFKNILVAADLLIALFITFAALNEKKKGNSITFFCFAAFFLLINAIAIMR